MAKTKLDMTRLQRKAKVFAGRHPTAAGIGGGLLLTLLLDSVVRGGMGLAGEVVQSGQEGQAMDIQGRMGPQMAAQQAMLPVTQAQKQAALYMLMQQLGAKGSPMLADGESLT